MNFPAPYLYQTVQWLQFWLKTHNKNHQCFEVTAVRTNPITGQLLSIRGLVYLYQWSFGQNIMHIPAGPYVVDSLDSSEHQFEGLPQTSQEEYRAIFIDFFHKVHNIAKDNQAVALRVNLDPKLAHNLTIYSADDLIHFIADRGIQSLIGLPVTTKSRLMFPSVAIINIGSTTPYGDLHSTEVSLPAQNKPLSLELLSQLLKKDTKFWLHVSETTRKQTRRSLTTSPRLVTEVTHQNIITAYELIQATAKRQGFSIPNLEYFETLAGEDFFQLLLIQDPQGSTHTAWIGLLHNGVLTNQYAGNDEIGLKNFWPNLAHLYGIYLARLLGCEWYDLGGYEIDSSQTRFKDGYKPEIINFIGGVDLVYLPWYYRIIELGGKSKRIFKK